MLNAFLYRISRFCEATPLSSSSIGRERDSKGPNVNIPHSFICKFLSFASAIQLPPRQTRPTSFQAKCGEAADSEAN